MSSQCVAYFLGGSLDLTKRMVEDPLSYFEVAVLEKAGFRDVLEDYAPLEMKREVYRLAWSSSSARAPRVLVYVLIER